CTFGGQLALVVGYLDFHATKFGIGSAQHGVVAELDVLARIVGDGQRAGLLVEGHGDAQLGGCARQLISQSFHIGRVGDVYRHVAHLDAEAHRGAQGTTEVHFGTGGSGHTTNAQVIDLAGNGLRGLARSHGDFFHVAAGGNAVVTSSATGSVGRSTAAE